MAKLTPTEAADKHARNLKSSLPDIVAGIGRVTENPGVKAANAKAKWVGRLQDPAVQDKWERNVRALDLGKWKADTAAKVQQRLAQGVDTAKPKMVSFYSQLFPYQDSLKGTVDNMPDVTLEDSINRMTTWVRGMANFKKS